MQTGRRKCGMVMTGIAVAALLTGSAAVAADRVVVIPLGGSTSYIVPDDSSACDAAKAGLLRFTGSVFQGCNGNVWLTLPGFDASVPTVFSSGHEWMDRNLGASRVATSSTDAEAYGDLYQWGRFTDGHEKRGSTTTAVLSDSDDPGHGDFITNNTYPYDWRNPQNDSLWQGVAGINNPCPAGFRLPAAYEWEAERLSWGANDAVGAYVSPLKLVAAGLRSYINGAPGNVGSDGYYWSSTVNVNGFYSHNLHFYGTNAFVYSFNGRADGFTVRCLKD